MSARLISGVVCCILALLAFTQSVRADDQADAANRAAVILNLMNDKKYGEVWDGYVSPYFKDKMTRNQFVANLTIGRSAFAPLSQSQQVGTEFNTQEPSFNYTGKIFAITFLNTYGTNKMYERLVIVLDADGQYRLGGIFGAPAQPAQQ